MSRHRFSRAARALMTSDRVLRHMPDSYHVRQAKAYRAWLVRSGRVAVDDYWIAEVENECRDAIMGAQMTVEHYRQVITLAPNSYMRKKARDDLQAAQNRLEERLREAGTPRSPAALERALDAYIEAQRRAYPVLEIYQVVEDDITLRIAVFETERDARAGLKTIEAFA